MAIGMEKIGKLVEWVVRCCPKVERWPSIYRRIGRQYRSIRRAVKRTEALTKEAVAGLSQLRTL